MMYREDNGYGFEGWSESSLLCLVGNFEEKQKKKESRPLFENEISQSNEVWLNEKWEWGKGTAWIWETRWEELESGVDSRGEILDPHWKEKPEVDFDCVNSKLINIKYQLWIIQTLTIRRLSILRVKLSFC